MAKTKELTMSKADQEKLMAEKVEEWIAIGLATGETPTEETNRFIRLSYKCGNFPEPKLIVHGTGPLAGAVMVAMLTTAKNIDEKVELKAPEDRQNPTDAVTRDPALKLQWDEIVPKAIESLAEQMADQEFPTDTDGRRGRRQELLDAFQAIEERVWKPYAWEALSHGIYGQHDAAWLGLYDYNQVLKPHPDFSRLEGLMGTVRLAGWWWMLQEVAVVTARPVLLKQDPENRLHAFQGPALAYPGGSNSFRLYRFNGIAVPSKYAETPAELMDAKEIITEENVDIRRAAMQKITYDRLYAQLGGKKLHEWNGYELISMNLGTDGDCPFFKMVNPSIKNPDGSPIYHVEGVPPGTDTVQKGLAWRNGTTELPEVLT